MNTPYFPPQFAADDYINDYRFSVDYDWSSQFIELRLIHYGGMGGRAVSVGGPIEMRPVGDGGRHIPPTLQLRAEAAQELMDKLWQCGLRPTEGTGSAGALAATQKHLDDMRKIALSMLEIQ